jgi:hypothetical protein
MNWIDIRVRKPEEKDSFKGNVWALFEDGSSGAKSWKRVATGDSLAIAWLDPKTLPKFTPIPDPPEGYRLKQDGDVKTDDAIFLHPDNRTWVLVSPHTCGWLDKAIYAVPIDPPKPQCRPFANAAEFEPYKNQWWRLKTDPADFQKPPMSFSDHCYGSFAWGVAFDICVFSDGTPFGIKVNT